MQQQQQPNNNNNTKSGGNASHHQQQPPDNYEISPYRDEDDEDDDDDDLDDDGGENRDPGGSKKNKCIPDWARGKNLRDALEAQAHVDPDVIFGARRTTVPLDELFGHPDPLRRNGGTSAAGATAASRYDDSRRGSSGNWADDGATWAEELAYKRAMGYPVPGMPPPPPPAAGGQGGCPPPPPRPLQQQQQQQQPSFLSRRG